jgi:peroxiredoxin
MNSKVIIAGAIGLVGLAYYFFSGPSKSVEIVAPTVNELPNVNIQKTDGAMMSLASAPEKSVLIFFDPSCDHCQNEAKQISERKQVFRDYSVYFVAADSIKSITKFATDYNLIEPNFYFAHAEGIDVYNTMGPMPSIPAIYIYNKRRLVKKFEGETKLEEIIKFL